jgi:oligosaccharide repeat unit polymerase
MSDSPAFTGLLIALVGVVAGLVLLRVRRADLHPASLVMIYTYAHVVLFVVRPFYLWMYQEGRNLFSNELVGDEYVNASIFASVGYFAVCVGYAVTHRSSQPEPTAGRLEVLDDWSWVNLRNFLVLITVGGALLYGVFIKQIGFANYLNILQEGRSAALSRSFENVSGYYSTGVQFSIGALLLLTVHFVSRRRPTFVFLCVLLLVVVVIPQVASGSRSVFIPVVTALLVLLARCRPGSITKFRALVMAPALFVLLFIVPRTYRTAAAQDVSTAASFKSAFTVQEALDNFVGSFDTAMIDAFAIQVQTQQAGSFDRLNGTSYLNALGAVIPRGIWPSKPGTIDQTLNAAIFPVTNQQGVGFSFGIYSEPYANFGAVGLVIVMLLVGLVLGRLNVLRSSNDTFRVWLYIVAAAYVFPVVRGSISFDVQRALIIALPVIAAVYAVKAMGSARRGSAEYRRADRHMRNVAEDDRTSRPG